MESHAIGWKFSLEGQTQILLNKKKHLNEKKEQYIYTQVVSQVFVQENNVDLSIQSIYRLCLMIYQNVYLAEFRKLLKSVERLFIYPYYLCYAMPFSRECLGKLRS